MTKYNNKVLLGTVLVGLILFYFVLTSYIESYKIYPEEREWFRMNLWPRAANDSCIDLGDANIYYYNDPSRIHYIMPRNEKNLVLLDLNFRKRCDFGELKLMVEGTNFSFPVYPVDDDKDIFQINKTDENRFEVILKDNDSEKWSYRLELIIPIEKSFYNYYRFNSPKIPLNVITFHYRNSLFGGYYSDEGSFYVLERPSYVDRPVRMDRYKWYDFDEEESVLINFTPKSRTWSLIQKILDAVILGLIAVVIYELFPEEKSKPKKRRKNKPAKKKASKKEF